MARRGPKQVSDEQKKAMAAGRADSRVVKAYLQGLEENRPKRGRKRTPDSIKKRLADIEDEINTADPLRRVNLFQERIDLTAELDRTDTAVDITALEKGFVKVAKGYGDRKAISYAAWRQVGVPPEVLRSAGITRGGN